MADRKRRRISRRRFLQLTALGAIAAGLGFGQRGCITVPPKLRDLRLGRRARALLKAKLRGLDPRKVVDGHVHVIGLGAGGTGCFVHPDAQSWLSPLRYVRTQVYKDAAGIYDDERADQLFVERLVDLSRYRRSGARSLLLAFDKNHTPDGEPDLALTEFHTPNDYVLDLADRHPDLFLACASIHPYRADAVDELRRVRARGARAVKWLPNAMGIDPADARCDAFYDELAALDAPLLTHAGEEQAVHAEEAQALGNPLRLRRALDRGVRVIVAHCASLGTDEDLDAKPDASGARPRVSCYALFRRLLDDPRYEGQLFGDLSAMTQFNRCGAPLSETLASPGIHARLLNGSDYPLPAVNPVIRTGLLVERGYLPDVDREAINEIYAWNPLEFDFVVKRRLRLARDGVTHRLPASAFETAHHFTRRS